MATVVSTGEAHKVGDRVLTGRWWLPSSPARVVSGSLTFAIATGGLLELSDTLMISGRVPPPQTLIFGLVEGSAVTVCDGQFAGQRQTGLRQDSQVEQESWRCRTAIVGAHAEQGTDTLFDRFTLRTANLGPWVDQPYPDHFDTASKVTVEVEIPEPLRADLGSGRTLTISWRHRMRTDRAHQSLTLEVAPEVMLSSGTSMTIADAWVKLLSPLLALISLATHAEDRLLELRGRPADRPSDRPAPLFDLQLLVTDWQQTPTAAAPEGPITQLLPFSAVQPRLEDVLRRWYDVTGAVRASVLDFSAAAFRPQVPLEERFIRIVRALETYHGGRVGGTYMDPVAYRHFRRKADESLDKEQRDFLAMRLAHANNRTLRQQLQDLFALPTGDPIWILLHSYRDFPRRVGAARNTLTHKGALGSAFDYQQLYWAELTLEWLYQRILLAELGFSDDEIGQLIKRTMAHRELHSPANRLAYEHEYAAATDQLD